MLAHPKSQAVVDNFAGQWLQLRNLRNKQPNSHEYPDFDDNLRRALQIETELFFASVMRENRSVVDLMTADYTFLNERLGRHYGIPGIYGSHFRRVTLTDDARRGLLGKGAILMVTSHAHRTSPVLAASGCSITCSARRRHPPPDVVPPFEETSRLPNRARSASAEQHRRTGVRRCHRYRPRRLALENSTGGPAHQGRRHPRRALTRRAVS